MASDLPLTRVLRVCIFELVEDLLQVFVCEILWIPTVALQEFLKEPVRPVFISSADRGMPSVEEVELDRDLIADSCMQSEPRPPLLHCI